MFLIKEMNCFNRPAYVDKLKVKAGIDDEGRQLFKEIDNAMSKSCKVDVRKTHPGCMGCRWQNHGDPRDNKAA